MLCCMVIVMVGVVVVVLLNKRSCLSSVVWFMVCICVLIWSGCSVLMRVVRVVVVVFLSCGRSGLIVLRWVFWGCGGWGFLWGFRLFVCFVSFVFEVKNNDSLVVRCFVVFVFC